MEVEAEDGVITIACVGFADDHEYTPEQRRELAAELAEAERGPLHGPFQTGEEIMAYVEEYKRKMAVQAKAED